MAPTETERAEQILATLDSEDVGTGTDTSALSAEEQALQILDAGDSAQGQDAGETGSDKTTEAVETQPETTVESIEPPASWKAEWKDQFKALPPETQKIIAERESERERGITKSQQESAEARKAAEAERAQVQAERQHYVQRLSGMIDQVKATDPIIAEGLRTDWVALSKENPALALQKKFEFDQRSFQLQALENERNAANARIRDEKFREGHKLLSEKLDFWNDEGKRTAFQSELAKTLTDHYGLKPEEAANIEDARAMLIARDAMRWRQHEASMAKVVPIRPKAPSAVMRSQPQNEGSKDERAEALKRSAIKSGRTEDAAAAILAAL